MVKKISFIVGILYIVYSIIRDPKDLAVLFGLFLAIPYLLLGLELSGSIIDILILNPVSAYYELLNSLVNQFWEFIEYQARNILDY